MKIKKGRRKKWRGIFIAGFVVLSLAILIVLFLILFQVRKINITGNSYVTEEQIVSWIQEDDYMSNSVYAWAKYKFTEPEQHPSLEAIEVNVKNPWTISVKVYEKTLVGFVYYDNHYVYFDHEGVVQEKSLVLHEGVPLIEGLPITGAVIYEKLPIDEEKIFEVILETTQMLSKYEIVADRVLCIDSELYLYFGAVCVRVGNSNIENRVIQIPPILEKLEGRKGILHLEKFKNSGDMISFEENVWPEEQQEE